MVTILVVWRALLLQDHAGREKGFGRGEMPLNSERFLCFLLLGLYS